MYKELFVPKNELKDVITELLEYCDEKEDDDELDRTEFSNPVSDAEIEEWEKENGIKIPETYKAWLRFSGDCIIDGTTAEFYSPKNFKTKYVPENLVIIGEQIGDGELVCFSKETGKIVTFFEGKERMDYGTFDETLKEVIRLMGKPEKENFEEHIENLKMSKANLEAHLDGSSRDKLRLEMISKIDEKLKSLRL